MLFCATLGLMDSFVSPGGTVGTKTLLDTRYCSQSHRYSRQISYL